MLCKGENIQLKIKVITLKDVSKYLVKIVIIFVVIAFFTKFFYDRKNVNSFFSFDSAKFVSTIKNEILLLKKNDINEIYSESRKYFSNTINNELSMFKLVATTNLNGITLGNNQSNNSNDYIDADNQIMDEPDQNNIGNNEESEQDATETEKIVEAQTGVTTEVLPSNIPDKATCEIFGVKLRSECDYNLEAEITDLDAHFNKNDILIFHTHTCESYTPTEQYQYESTGNYRTTDLNYTVSRVGDELEKYLTNYGYNVVHNKSYHDYPAYNGSYNRSLVTVKKLLEQYTNTDIVIDLHRDAIGDNSYAPKIKIGDDYCARIMFVIGTDGGGLSHDNWRNNLKFAMKVVQKGNELYPGFFKPIIVRNSRYNHHLADAACIIEVGATGNTLEECLNSMKYLAKIYNEVQ